jgi:carbon monoxide dehydrogenase subunit G
MKIYQEFVVASPPDLVWGLFQDVPSVAQCLPGATLTGQNEDGSYDGALTAKLGPMTASFEGRAIVTPSLEGRTATIEGKGVDRKGGSRGQVKVRYSVHQDEIGTRVTVDAGIMLSGPAAQFGRTGLINEMSKRLIEEFVLCLEAKCLAASEVEANAIQATELKGLSIFFASLWAWLKGIFGGGEE